MNCPGNRTYLDALPEEDTPVFAVFIATTFSETAVTWSRGADTGLTSSDAKPCNGIIRWYDPITGRWLSNDPIGISGGLNMYQAFESDPVNNTDPFGLDIVLQNTPSVNGWHRRVGVDTQAGLYGQSFGMSDRNAEMIGSSAGSVADDPARGRIGSGVVYPDSDPATKEVYRFKTTPEEDIWAIQQLQSELWNTGPYNWLTKSCRSYSKQKYKELVREIKNQRKKAKKCP